MNEFIEKLIGRLEEEYNYQKTKAFQASIDVGCGEEPKMVTEERSRYRNAQCFDASILIVKELAKEYKGGWIPCGERLPEDGVKVLVTYIYENKLYADEILHRFEGDWYFGDVVDEMSFPCDVIAWQPLPEPYKKVGAE